MLLKGEDNKAQRAALHEAAGKSESTTLQALIDRVNAESGAHQVGKIEMLESPGGDIKARGNNSSTALHEAAENGGSTTLQALIDAFNAKREGKIEMLESPGYADIKARGNNGSTALHEAAYPGLSATDKAAMLNKAQSAPAPAPAPAVAPAVAPAAPKGPGAEEQSAPSCQ
jgi:ankyrin repeat protein